MGKKAPLMLQMYPYIIYIIYGTVGSNPVQIKDFNFTLIRDGIVSVSG